MSYYAHKPGTDMGVTRTKNKDKTFKFKHGYQVKLISSSDLLLVTDFDLKPPGFRMASCTWASVDAQGTNCSCYGRVERRQLAMYKS